jgi:hypothetical protein
MGGPDGRLDAGAIARDGSLVDQRDRRHRDCGSHCCRKRASTGGNAMETLITMVAQRAGLSEDKARAAVETVIGFLKQRAPAGLSGQIDSLVSGGEGASAGGVASAIGGMFGEKKA